MIALWLSELLGSIAGSLGDHNSCPPLSWHDVVDPALDPNSTGIQEKRTFSVFHSGGHSKRPLLQKRIQARAGKNCYSRPGFLELPTMKDQVFCFVYFQSVYLCKVP